jgi:hypothetical protein
MGYDENGELDEHGMYDENGMISEGAVEKLASEFGISAHDGENIYWILCENSYPPITPEDLREAFGNVLKIGKVYDDDDEEYEWQEKQNMDFDTEEPMTPVFDDNGFCTSMRTKDGKIIPILE